MNIIPWRRNESLLPRNVHFDDFLDRFWGNGDESPTSHLPEAFKSRPFPAINIAETEDSFCITMDCPGLEEDDFAIQTMGRQLLISGERKWEDETEGKEFRRVESQFGRFERSVPLPDNARTDAKTIEARYKKGILTVTVPKLEKTPAAKIPVHAG